MKLSVAVAPDNAPDNAFVVFRGLESSIKKASELGYHGIELAISCAADAEAPNLSKWLAAYRMEISAISTGLVYAGKGISLLETPDTAVPLFLELVDVAADFGKQVNIGRSRGFKKNRSLHDAADDLKKILVPVMDHAARKGVTLLLEPVNRYEIDWINSVEEGAIVLDRIKAECLGLMPDVFHMNIEDKSIGESFRKHKNYVKYIHLADSNRHAPGWGHLDFNEVFSSLRDIGYKDWLSVEILPVPNPDKAAKQAADYLLPFLAGQKTR
ncbi:MAG: sugar phosphate isomerase/epimerase [Treponema sp.]|jgi:sugar phosphate isomerase/epimerase|nr:sugar phosphate isomerase/epimerase [Treponema sp.]